jgi:hypothetical protein
VAYLCQRLSERSPHESVDDRVDAGVQHRHHRQRLHDVDRRGDRVRRAVREDEQIDLKRERRQREYDSDGDGDAHRRDASRPGRRRVRLRHADGTAAADLRRILTERKKQDLSNGR